MTHRRPAILIAVFALLVTTFAPFPAAPASAAVTVVASDLTDGASVNLISYTDDPAVPFGSPGDGFQIYQRGVSSSFPFAVLDDSLSAFPADDQGVIDETVTGLFFGVVDTVNGDTTGPVTATWQFSIAGASNLNFSVDVGAMGDFEASDSFAWAYSIDAGAPQPLLALTVDEAGSQDYTLAGGATYTLADPLTSGATTLTNVLTTLTAPLAGAGSVLTITFTALANGGEEAVAFRNLIISGDGDVPPAAPGDLVINEVMQNPSAVSDGSGEWLEIYNSSANDIDIDGWTIRDDDFDSHVITNGGPLVVPAGGYAVLGNNVDSATNGGAAVNYAYAGLFLSNGGDEVVLVDPGGVEFDRIAYDGGPVWPDPNGASMSLDPAFANTAENDDGANWCEGSTTYGAGDLGTPGAANPECPAPPVDPIPIHEVQGSGASVAISGPVLVQGVVTSLFERDDALDGFFVQEEDADADGDPATSEGIFVFCRGICPDVIAVGDVATVSGSAEDFFGMSQIDMESVTIDGTAPLPTAATLSLPAVGSTTAAPTFENLEAMIITSPNTLVVSEYFQLARFGQIVLTDAARPFQFTHLDAPSAPGYEAFLADLATRRIILDDDNNDNNDAISDGPDEAYAYPDGGLSTTNKVRGGDTITGLTGVLHWSWAGGGGTDAWRIRPIDGVANTFASANPEPTSAPDVGGSLTVAAFNVLNYFTTLDTGANICGPSGDLGCRGANSAAELDRQRDKIVTALVKMDAEVVGLVELENDSDTSIADLVAGLNAVLGAGTYDYIATGFIGDDAIKVGYIYQPATVTPAGDFAILDSSVDPTFVDSKNRPVLVQTFDENATDERFTVAVTHLKSKGSDCDALGDPDLGDGQANCSQTRAQAAVALANYLDTDPTDSADPDFLIVGDLNAYAMEDAVTALKAAGYTDLLNFFGGSNTYTYVFDGQIGYLDYGLANDSLLSQLTGTAPWAINADEINVFDYNDDIRDPGEASFHRESSFLSVYSPDELRSSDHDPVLVGLALDSIPDNPQCFGQTPTILGTPGDDWIVGTDGDDVIMTFGGDDYINAGAGRDIICSGYGHDEIDGGDAKDLIDAGPNDDVIWGGNSKDEIDGGDGFDTIDGGNGMDVCVQGEDVTSCEK